MIYSRPQLSILGIFAFILVVGGFVVIYGIFRSSPEFATGNRPAQDNHAPSGSENISGGEAPHEDAEGEAPHTHGDEEEATPSAPINDTNLPLILPEGFRIELFSPQGLGTLRMMAFSPDGMLFVSRPNNSTSLYSGSRSGGAILAFPDRDNNGKADEVTTVISGLKDLPHGIAFYDNYLYVAEEKTISRYLYKGNATVGAREVVVSGLPGGGDGHISRTVGFSPLTDPGLSTTGKMYVSIGSSCNICEESDARRATIMEYNPDGTEGRVYASGLRNAVGFDFHPYTGEVWASDNGRDRLGDDLPPDEMNLVREGLHYGWPYCYGQRVVDQQFSSVDFCLTTEPSVFDIQAHSAALGIRFIRSPQFPPEWDTDILVAYHGSWNRSEPTGYKIARLDLEEHRINFQYDFITGWLRPDGSKLGRPVDLVFGPDGALYISDDKVGVIYRVTKI